jgi:hypothetical protein
MNRGRLSIWVLVGGALLAILSVLSYGTLLVAVVIITPAAGMLAFGVWIRLSLHSAPSDR